MEKSGELRIPKMPGPDCNSLWLHEDRNNHLRGLPIRRYLIPKSWSSGDGISDEGSVVVEVYSQRGVEPLPDFLEPYGELLGRISIYGWWDMVRSGELSFLRTEVLKYAGLKTKQPAPNAEQTPASEVDAPAEEELPRIVDTPEL